MFHAISGWLTRHARQIRDYRQASDLAAAARHGWQATEIKPGTIAYRDPRFDRIAQPAPARPTWAHATVAGRIRTLPIASEPGAGRRCS